MFKSSKSITPLTATLLTGISKFIKIFLMAAFIVAAVQSPTFAANTETIQVVNQTDKTIVSIEGVVFNRKWNGKDLLGNNVLYDGGTMNIHYDPKFQSFNLRITFEDGKRVTWNKVIFKGAARLILYNEGGTYKYVRQ